MNASEYQLPQHVSDDRRRARAEILAMERKRFALKRDEPLGDLPEGFRLLPPGCAVLPPDQDFPASKIYGELAAYRLWTAMNLLPGTARWMPLFRSPSRYQAIFQGILGPREAMSRWREDGEFGRQRLTGVNPMQVRLLREDRRTALWKAAERVLAAHKPAHLIGDLFRQERLFYTDYGVLWHARIQKIVHRGTWLAAPTCLFWQDDTGHLMPLAIQLKPEGEPKNPVFTTLDPAYDWLMARVHAQSADTHTHEGTYHLLETHLVSGIVALCMYRQLHPDHPVRQLLEPHYEQNLAINKLALGGLLARGGTIDTAFAGGVDGTLDAARAFYTTWSWDRRSLHADLEERGVEAKGDKLPFYYYREDAVEVYAAVKKYVSSMLALYYENDGEVQADYELQRWVAEVAGPDKGGDRPAGGDVPGFPAKVETREQLYALIADMIFRAGPQHAAVNNGQFDAYGWIPNSPALVCAPLPEEPSPEGGHFSEQAFWRAFPRWSPATSQVNMVWVLSAPTRRTLLHAGESPAFHPSICPEADAIIGGFRRRLQTISESILRRNQTLDVPYRFLDPVSISRSTDI